MKIKMRVGFFLPLLVLSLTFLSYFPFVACSDDLDTPAEPLQSSVSAPPSAGVSKQPRVSYPKKTEVDLDGMSVEGELKSPGEFYFMHKPQEKMDSLVKRRKNFHREMLRDAVSGR